MNGNTRWPVRKAWSIDSIRMEVHQPVRKSPETEGGAGDWDALYHACKAMASQIAEFGQCVDSETWDWLQRCMDRFVPPDSAPLTASATSEPAPQEAPAMPLNPPPRYDAAYSEAMSLIDAPNTPESVEGRWEAKASWLHEGYGFYRRADSSESLTNTAAAVKLNSLESLARELTEALVQYRSQALEGEAAACEHDFVDPNQPMDAWGWRQCVKCPAVRSHAQVVYIPSTQGS